MPFLVQKKVFSITSHKIHFVHFAIAIYAAVTISAIITGIAIKAITTIS